MNPWFRFYESALDDPKVQLLPPDLFKFWVNCLCLACRNSGVLPPFQSVSFSFRVPLSVVESSVSKLKDAGLIDERRGTFFPHNWNKRQYQSDVSTERVKRFRKRSIDVSGNVSETPSDTDTDTEQTQIQNRTEEENTPIVPLKTFGEFGRCKLTDDQFSKLKTKLNGHHEAYIEAFDHWVNEAPEARPKGGGPKRKERHAYESITAWYNRDVREGKVKTSTHSSKNSSQLAEELRRRHGLQ